MTDTDRAFLGKQVAIKLDEATVVEGRFLAFGDGGDFIIQDDSGFLHYCWPMLAVSDREPSPTS